MNHYAIYIKNEDFNNIAFAKCDNKVSLNKFVKMALENHPVVVVKNNGVLKEMFFKFEDGSIQHRHV